MRQLLSETPLGKDGTLTVSGGDFVHLRTVLRMQTGDMVLVRFPNGELVSMTVSGISDAKKSALLQICGDVQQGRFFRGEKANENASAAVDYTLFQCVTKMQTFERIIRQAVECGIKHLIPIAGEYSQAQFIKALQSETRSARLQKIIKEAREQSGSATNTSLHAIMSIAEAVRFWHAHTAENRAGFVLSERKDFCIAVKDIRISKAISSVGLFVGSEGGIGPAEIEMLRRNDFTPIHIHDNILKSETASVYGIALLQTLFSLKSAVK